jgi:hypothetical protein
LAATALGGIVLLLAGLASPPVGLGLRAAGTAALIALLATLARFSRRADR